MLPVALGPSAHHDQVSRRRCQIVGGALARMVGVAGRAGPKVPRPLGAEGEDRCDGVLQPAHVGVAVEGLTVVPVPVEGHREATEADPVAVLEDPRDLGQRRVGQRPPR